MKVLVTGSSGLIGSEAVRLLDRAGHIVSGIDNNMRREFFGPGGDTTWVLERLRSTTQNFTHHTLDIRDRQGVLELFKNEKYDMIIHCAAQPSHDYGKNYPLIDFNVNATGTLNLLELTKKYCSNSPFIFMSTNKVYGDNPNKLPLLEGSKRWELNKKHQSFKGIDEKFSIDNCTHSFFGVSKTYADLIVQEYGKNLGLKTVCFRGGCITGPNHSGAKLHGFLSYLVKSSILHKRYSIIGYKGKQVRDNLHSEDLINCFWEFYKKPKKGVVYNIGGGRYSNCSIIEALDLVEDISKIKIQKKFLKENRTGDHIWYISNLNKFKKDYPNWKQRYNTKKIIKQLVDRVKKDVVK